MIAWNAKYCFRTWIFPEREFSDPSLVSVIFLQWEKTMFLILISFFQSNKKETVSTHCTNTATLSDGFQNSPPRFITLTNIATDNWIEINGQFN